MSEGGLPRTSAARNGAQHGQKSVPRAAVPLPIYAIPPGTPVHASVARAPADLQQGHVQFLPQMYPVPLMHAGIQFTGRPGTPARPDSRIPVLVPPHKQRASPRSIDEKLDEIYKLMVRNKMSMGRFLYLSFRQHDEDGAVVTRSSRHANIVSKFLCGDNTHTASHVVQLMFNDASSQPPATSSERHLEFSVETPHSEIRYARPALSAWAASLCCERIVRDAKRATKPDGGLHGRVQTAATRRARRADLAENASSDSEEQMTKYLKWSDLGSGLVETVRGVVEEKCPLLWAFLVRAGSKPPRPNQVPVRQGYRPVENVVTGAIGDILFCRNKAANLLQLSRGISLFATRAEESLYRIGSRFGNNVAYSTVVNALETLTQDGEDWLRNASDSDILWLMLIIDNAQHYVFQHETRFGRESTMAKGVAGTGVGIRGAADAWDLDSWAAAQRADRSKITLKSLMAKINFSLIDLRCILNWVDVLVKFVTALEALRPELDKRFEQVAVAPVLPVEHRTPIQPLRSNACDPAKTTEMHKALLDFFVTQLNQTKDRWKRRVTFVGGDGGTYESLLRLKKYLQTQYKSEYDQMVFMIPILMLWHTKWTILGRIINNWWGSARSSDASCLGHGSSIARKKPPTNLKKPDFHSATEMLFLVGETRMLDCWRTILNVSDLQAHFSDLKERNALPSLEDLIAIAKKLHRTYSSPKAAAQALFPYGDQPSEYRAPLAVPRQQSTVSNPDLRAVQSDIPAAPSPPPPEDENEPVDTPVETLEAAVPEASHAAGGASKSAGISGHTEAEGFEGDRWLANSVCGLADFIPYRHWCHATSRGHVGEIWEIFKMETVKFAGSGHNPKYTNFGLEMFIMVEFECNAAMREAVLSSLLVNPSGQKGHFKEGDLMQEHLINRLDRQMQHKDKSYDSRFIRNVVTPNLDSLVELPRNLEAAVGLTARSTRHKPMHQRPEVHSLLKAYAESQPHRFSAGRSTGFAAKESFGAGLAALQASDGPLAKFLIAHQRENDVFNKPTPSSHTQRAAAVESAMAEEIRRQRLANPTTLQDMLESAPDQMPAQAATLQDLLDAVPSYDVYDELAPPAAGVGPALIFDSGEFVWEDVLRQLDMMEAAGPESADGFRADIPDEEDMYVDD